MRFLVLNAPPTRLVWTKRPVPKPVPLAAIEEPHLTPLVLKNALET
jgi:hypothetical protein